jgi:DNA helicase-2/ATP-dependent DNA helicase PcrA
VSEPSDERDLDEEQQAAVIAPERAIAVLAGPGSGKTRTLSHRARHLLSSHPGSRALLLTFTNKAAAEMKARALAVGNLGTDRIDAGTFHGFGARFLRNHGTAVGIQQSFEIIDESEREELAQETTARHGISDRHREWSYRRLRGARMHSELEAFGAIFESEKRTAGVVDFDDLVIYTAQLLEANEELCAAYAARFQHVMVDEFQDTNAAHFSIVSALAKHAATVSVFADDDQAIMRFAGADAANVARFTRELEAKPYPLNWNYRCREQIVLHANKLITADPNPSGRQMRAKHPDGHVELRRFSDTTAEALALGGEIASMVLEQQVPASSVAVLSRAGPRANELVEVLMQAGVPVTDWRGTAYESEERRLLVACVSTVRARLSDRHAARLFTMLGVEPGDERDTNLFLSAHAGSPVADALLSLREQALQGAGPRVVVEQAQRAIAAHDATAGERALELVDAVADFERLDASFSLDQLLAELVLKSGGRSPTTGGGVKIATLHGTKGLQWPTVFLIGMEQGKLPDFRAVQAGDVGDERRTCFVGVCRAEDRLLLSYATTFRGFSQHPSQFLAEMGL